MTEIIKRDDTDMAMMERVVIGGDLAALEPAQRVNYYRNVCQSVGLNPLTKPFEYIKLNGKLTLYARKDATDQLRKLYGISISKPDIQFMEDVLMVAVTATDANGRTDSDVGVVTVVGLKGDNKANAIMKAITKAKRRVTLSIAGLGWLDESEIETIRSAQTVTVDQSTGEIVGEVSSAELDARAKLEVILDEIGEDLYADNWPSVKSHNIKRLTDGGEPTSEDYQRLIEGMRKLVQQRKQPA